jgi:hypothetical protein
MDRYMAVLRWTLKHPLGATVVGGFLRFGRDRLHVHVAALHLPRADRTRSPSTSRWRRARRSSRPRASPSRRGDHPRSSRRWSIALRPVRVGGASISGDAEGGSRAHQHRVPARGRAAAAVIPTPASSSARRRGGGRDVSINLGGEDPVQLTKVANKLVEEMQGAARTGARRASAATCAGPRSRSSRGSTWRRSSASPPQALSQAIRVATIGEIDQNSARFSLSDRQIPIRVGAQRRRARDLSTIENLPVPTTTGGSVPLKVVAEISFGAGPTRSSAATRCACSASAPISRPAWSTARRARRSRAADDEEPADRRAALVLGQQRMAGRDDPELHDRLVSGLLLVLRGAGPALQARMPPLVNMGSLLLAPLGGLLALVAHRPADLAAGLSSAC